METNKKTTKITVVRYMSYSEDEIYHIEVPEELVFYEFDYWYQDRKHYTAICDYDESLYEIFNETLYAEAFKIEDKLIICVYNGTNGVLMKPDKATSVSCDLNYFAEQFKAFLKTIYFMQYQKCELSKEEMDDFFEQLNTDDIAKKTALIDECQNKMNRLLNIYKILDFDGYFLKMVDMYLEPDCGDNTKIDYKISIEYHSFRDLFNNFEDSCTDYYKKYTTDSSLFNEHFKKFREIIE